MKRLTVIFGSLALLLAIADVVHGPHNGDRHRFYIHLFELIALIGFLGQLEALAFIAIDTKCKFNRWLTVTGLSFMTAVLGLLLFGISGGSFHGDGGPIATSFLLLATLGYTVFPVSLIGFIVVAISRQQKKIPILDK